MKNKLSEHVGSIWIENEHMGRVFFKEDGSMEFNDHVRSFLNTEYLKGKKIIIDNIYIRSQQGIFV